MKEQDSGQALLQNSVFFLLVVNAAMFFLCATTLAWVAGTTSFRRVTEAILLQYLLSVLFAVVILLAIVFGNDHAHLSLDGTRRPC